MIYNLLLISSLHIFLINKKTIIKCSIRLLLTTMILRYYMSIWKILYKLVLHKILVKFFFFILFNFNTLIFRFVRWWIIFLAYVFERKIIWFLDLLLYLRIVYWLFLQIIWVIFLYDTIYDFKLLELFFFFLLFFGACIFVQKFIEIDNILIVIHLYSININIIDWYKWGFGVLGL